jgi:tetratricopeptide (TPR) repeat protein
MIFPHLLNKKLLKCSIFLSVLFYESSLHASLKLSEFVDQQEKNRIIKKISQLLKDKYVYPDLGEKFGQQLQVLFKSGVFDRINNAKEFSEILSKDLQQLMNDKHIYFRLIEASDIGEAKEGSLHHPVRLFRLGQKEHLGFNRLDWIEGDIGYLDYRRFYYNADAREMLSCAIKFLSSANAIIIDLRENQGGSMEMIPFISSYFFPFPTQLTGIYYREQDLIQEIWTVENIEGERLLNVPLFLLVSRNSFSAAESFAYDMKVSERATLVGDSTRGGAHSVDLFDVEDRFEIYIPTARAIHPLTMDNWEGSGIIPDILVPSEIALDTAVALAKEAAREFGKTKDLRIKNTIQIMQKYLHQADGFFKINKEKFAKVALDSAFIEGKKLKLMNEFFIQVLVYFYSSEKNYKMVEEILKRQMELFPNAVQVYESLAWSYLEQDKKTLAMSYFEKILELNPGNSVAIQMIKRLKDK